MIGLHHTIVIFFGVLGLVLGGILIDLDHHASWTCKWKGYWSYDHGCTFMKQGIFHRPLVMLSCITFFFGLGFGMLIHLFMDYIKFVR